MLILRSDSLNSYGIFQPVQFRKDTQGSGAMYWAQEMVLLVLHCSCRAEDKTASLEAAWNIPDYL